MRFNPETVSPRLVVAVLWIASMVMSGAGGTFLIGFDLGTTLIWVALTLLGPLLVWGFVAATKTRPQPQRPATAKAPQTQRPQAQRRAPSHRDGGTVRHA